MHRLVPVLILFALACASPPEPRRIGATALEPGPGERVAVDTVVLLVDSSGSVPAGTLFPVEKALVEDFVSSMPAGDYEAGAVTFGGYERVVYEIGPFDRSRATQEAANLKHLSEGTPLYKVFAEIQPSLATRSGRAAILVFTDGLPSDEIGRDVDPQRTLDAAGRVASAHDGEVCIHTVQVGGDPAGAEFLRTLSQVTPCGTFRTASTVTNTASLYNFQREVFLGAAPVVPAVPAVAAAPRDSDGDEVYDTQDQCPGTPRGASVDARGCWVISGLEFGFDSNVVQDRYHGELDGIVAVLAANPDMRVRVDGYTDDIGAVAYNEGLSQRRAEAVRDFLVSAGIDTDRVEAKGWGEANPAVSNDSDANRRQNRRTEITVLR